MDKVQSFLYDVLQAQIQEKKSKNKTLKTIIESSQLISDQFYQDIGIEENRGQFSGHLEKTLLQCSGMCVFVTSFSEMRLLTGLKLYFKTYYTKLSGLLFMK